MPWDSKYLERVFNPSTVAVIGSRRADNYMWLRNVSDFKGKLYSVQVDPNDITGIEEMGIPNYKSLMEIPGPVDYALIAVPRRVVPFILKDVIAKGVKAAHMFTSGFAEAGEEGAEAQRQLTKTVRDAGLVLLGPNCMGLYNPEAGLRTGPDQEVGKSGSVAIVSQSGAHHNNLVQAIQSGGVGVRKGISFGNAIVLDSPDLLEYFDNDPNTKIIMAYIEGPKDGRRLFETLRKVAQHKPVVLWKGGQTEAGQRSAASHTGSLAGSSEVWRAVARQTGAILVGSIEEAVDMVKALYYLPPALGDRIGIIGGSGGQSVSMSDDFSKAALRVPVLSQPTLQGMSTVFQLVGASYYNPVDIGIINRKNMETIVDLLVTDPNIDAVAVMLAAPNGRRSPAEVKADLEIYKNAMKKTGKPVMAMFWAPVPYKDGDAFLDLDKTLQELGIPAFASPQRAAWALRKMVDYHAFRQEAERSPA